MIWHQNSRLKHIAAQPINENLLFIAMISNQNDDSNQLETSLYLEGNKIMHNIFNNLSYLEAVNQAELECKNVVLKYNFEEPHINNNILLESPGKVRQLRHLLTT